MTGATGYVGSRLVPELVARGHEVAAAVRREGGADRFPWADRVQVRRFDLDEHATVASAVEGMDAVVYLVHSMASGDFVEKDRRAADLVASACDAAGVGRIVYLSGLVPEGDLSDHLRSRLEVETVFLEGPVPAVVLRAAMVIGAGSTSFEILRRLTSRVPLTPIPAWMRHDVQPVSIEEVVLTIGGALEAEPGNDHFDIGGDEVCSYPRLLATLAEVMDLRRPQLVVPWVPAAVVGRIVAGITRMDRPTVLALVESLAHDMVCRGDDADRAFLPAGYQSPSLREVLRRSLAQGSADGTSHDGDVQAAATTDTP